MIVKELIASFAQESSPGSAEELKHLNEILLDLFRGVVTEHLNLAEVDRVYVCILSSPTTVYMVHCDLCIKSLQKEAMKIGRAVVEYCDEGQSVKNFISLGGPHTIFFTNAMS
jgi:hypothetical protein